MKKFFLPFTIFLFSFLLVGCNLNKSQYIRPEEKPTSNYYTNEIIDKLESNESYTIKVFDLNIYKYYKVDKEEHSILMEFVESLSSDNFISEIDENLTPSYKIIIEFPNDKYIINAYTENLVSIYPWDGIYKEDIISMDGVSDYYNIYKFCDYIKKISRGFEG